MTKAIDQFITARDKLRNWEALVLQTLETHEAVFDSFMQDERYTLRFNSYAEDIEISFSGKATDLQEFWRRMRLLGYKPSIRPSNSELMTYFGAFWTKEGYARVWMYFTSSVCKRVKIGEETVTETRDVYEIRCEG